MKIFVTKGNVGNEKERERERGVGREEEKIFKIILIVVGYSTRCACARADGICEIFLFL